MDCVIHIGTEKTGTTSIQRTLDANAKRLLERGFYWPPVMRSGQNPRIVCYSLDDETIDLRKRRRQLTTPETIAEFRIKFEDRLRREIKKASNANMLLIVNEHLSRLEKRQELERLKQLIERFADRIRIVVYLRRQDRLMCSMYSQVIKIGGTRENVFPVRSVETEGDFITFNYRRIVDLWADVFGREALNIRTFEPESLVQGDVVMDFFDVAGLEGLTGIETTRINESLSVEALLTMRELNRHLPRTARGHLGPLSGQLFAGSGMPVARDDAHAFLNEFEADNDYVARQYLGRSRLFKPIGDAEYPDNVDPETFRLSPQSMAWHFAQLWQAREREV
ncbi:MAG: hypothetical protein AAF674_22375 [Pseudomonadota bacterium]